MASASPVAALARVLRAGLAGGRFFGGGSAPWPEIPAWT